MNKKIIGLLVIILLVIAVPLAVITRKNSENDSVVKVIYNDTNEVNEIDSEVINLDDSSDKLIITEEGSYTLTGENSGVVVNASGKVYLILDNVTIKNETGAAIYVENADEVYIVLKEGTVNTLIDGSKYSYNTDEDIDATIYSKDDLIIMGDGTLNITASYNHGIHSKDYVQIISGVINIDCVNDGIVGKDYVAIKDGNITINSKSDGIKSNNDEDKSLGYIAIDGGNITITSTGDAINAGTTLSITGGKFNINTKSNSSDTSSKGLKAENLITIDGGEFTINSSDDSIHSNKDLKINNGNFTIKSSDDGVHADGLVEINNGTLKITAHEGIEGTYIKINDGTINITATDDGINAGNKSSAYSVKIEINGGNITINMGQGDTDGIDSNGDIYINGGILDITANSPFDYDGTAKYTSGTIIVNGNEINQITNQMMGGRGNMNQKGQNANGNIGGRMPGRR